MLTSFPLPAPVAAKLLAQLVLRSLGGPGSGNFGHDGRPGEVGGSSGLSDREIKSALGPRHEVMPREKFDQLREAGWTPKQAMYSEAIQNRKGEPNHPHVRVVQLSPGMLGPYRFVPPGGKAAYKDNPKVYEGRHLGGSGSGNFGHSGRKGEVGGSEGGGSQARSEKSLKALKAFIPIHAESQRYAEKNELVVRRMTGGVRTDDNLPVDVIAKLNGKTVGIEVKTMVNNTNDKITMRKDAIDKKIAWGRANHASVHTVVLDDRGRLGNKGYSGHRIYYRKGPGSFRLSSMVKVQSAAHLRALLGGKSLRATEEFPKTLGGPGSGNFGHAGRPGEVGGSSADSGVSEGPKRAEPSKEEIVRMHELLAQGHAPTTVATKMGWGGVSGSRGKIVTDIASRYDQHGNLRGGVVQPPPPPVTPPVVTPPPSPVAKEPDPGQPIPTLSAMPLGPKTGELADPTFGGKTTWYDAHGKPISVTVEPGSTHIVQKEVRDTLQRIPSQFIDGASKTRARSQFDLGPKGRFELVIASRLQGNTILEKQGIKSATSAGQYSLWENRITIAHDNALRAPGDAAHVLAHEIGHGLQYNSSRYFGGKRELSTSYRQDRAAIVAGKRDRGVYQDAYEKLSYYRANWKEANAESIATHLTPSYMRNSATFRVAHFASMATAQKGLNALLGKKVKG